MYEVLRHAGGGQHLHRYEWDAYQMASLQSVDAKNMTHLYVH